MSRGVYSLPIHDRERLIRGAEHVVRLGGRVLGELLLEVARDVPDLLARLDDYRRLPPDVADKLGARQWTAPVVAMLRRAA